MIIGWATASDLTAVSQGYEREASDRSRVYAQKAEYQITHGCMALATAEQPQCVRDTEQAKRENQRDEQDLAAQKISAWWTRVMGIAALLGMGLSIVGVYLVWTTFRETRRSADEAARANSNTEKSIQDARIAARPKLNINIVALIITAPRPEPRQCITVMVGYGGGNAAYEVCVTCRSTIEDSPIEEMEMVPPAPPLLLDLDRPMSGGHGWMFVWPDIVFSGNDVLAMHGKAIYTDITVTYLNDFGDRQVVDERHYGILTDYPEAVDDIMHTGARADLQRIKVRRQA